MSMELVSSVATKPVMEMWYGCSLQVLSLTKMATGYNPTPHNLSGCQVQMVLTATSDSIAISAHQWMMVKR